MKSAQVFACSFLMWGALFFACNQNPAPASLPPENALAPAPARPSGRPDVYLYAVMVDKLNLRDQPAKSGQVTGQLAEGTFAEGSGEVSSNKEEATLRGVVYLEPYIRVSSTAPDRKTGWAFGGALQCVYAGSRAEIPDLEKLTQLTGFFKTLDTKNLESGKSAWDFTASRFGASAGSLADAAFILLEKFLFRMEREGEFYRLTEKVKWSDEDYQAIARNKFDFNKYPVSKSLADSGFGLTEGEGMVFPTVDWNRLQAFFGQKVTPAMKTYLDQQLAERKRQAWADGGIVIPLEELADRAAFWEKFNGENPYFPLNDQTRESERWMRLILVTGSDNSPTYDSENQAITEDFKKTWAYVQQKYPGTKLAQKTKEIADLCAAGGWKRTKQVEAWQTKYANEN